MVIESKNEAGTETIRDTNLFKDTNGIFEVEKNQKQKEENAEEGYNNCKVCLGGE